MQTTKVLLFKTVFKNNYESLFVCCWLRLLSENPGKMISPQDYILNLDDIMNDESSVGIPASNLGN